MKTRIIIGAVMIAILSGILWFDGYMESSKMITREVAWGVDTVVLGTGVAVILGVIAVMAVFEVAAICKSAGLSVLPTSAIICTCAVGLCPFWRQFIDIKFQSIAFILTIGFSVWAVFLEQMIRFRIEDAIKRLAGTFLLICYLGIGGALLLKIRLIQPHGLGKLILFIAAVKCTDIGAYFTGSFIGKHKMIKWLSPGKTWEGLAGGVITAAAVSILINLIGGLELNVLFAGIFGALVGIVGQFGDLCESLLKRSAAIKDSGSKLPEFGGVLDIIDSPLIAAPLAYLLLVI